MEKKKLRKFYFTRRKKKYFEINKFFFLPLKKLIIKNFKKKKLYISLYYPNSFELNVFRIFELEYFKKVRFLLPIIEDDKSMSFYDWKKNDILYVNKFGILEPTKSQQKTPNVILVPLLAYDKKKNRLGYGGGYYDRFFKKYLQTHKNILIVGVAFSFQKHHKLPANSNDFKLNYIITEKGILK